MSRYISKRDRKQVKERAKNCCEYCLMPESFSLIGYEIDHIIALKHGGLNELSNLAFACAICNYRKGTDIGTILLPSHDYIRFFNPKIDNWTAHFELSGYSIHPKSSIGKGTIKIFQLNELRRIEERELLVLAGLFPHS